MANACAARLPSWRNRRVGRPTSATARCAGAGRDRALLAVSVEPEAIRFEGAENIRTFQSSDWAERAWCDRCGSTLYYRVTIEGYGPRTYEMSLGLFDTPDAFPLSKEIYIDRKPSIYAFAGERETLTEAETEARFTAPETGAQ